MSDTSQQPVTYTITCDNPATGLQIVRAQLSADGASAEVDRLRAQGMENIKVTPVSNAPGDLG